MLRGELTILTISHQPAVLDVADRAYRLDQGKAVLTLDRMAPAGEQKDAPAAFG
jgi:ABC-type glutathione transport system ATPase component